MKAHSNESTPRNRGQSPSAMETACVSCAHYPRQESHPQCLLGFNNNLQNFTRESLICCSCGFALYGMRPGVLAATLACPFLWTSPWIPGSTRRTMRSASTRCHGASSRSLPPVPRASGAHWRTNLPVCRARSATCSGGGRFFASPRSREWLAVLACQFPTRAAHGQAR